MKNKVKVILPIYGLSKNLSEKASLSRGLLIRPIDLLKNEHGSFKKYGIHNYSNTLIEINYEYDEDDPNEPYPAVEINFVQKIESALRVYGFGSVGIAAIIFGSSFNTIIRSTHNPLWHDNLKEQLNDFPEFFNKYQKAYNLRPMAFQSYSRSRERVANNDKTVDCCTTLESLFVPRDEWKKSPFILQGLSIMGFEEKERRAVDDLIKYRNSIIHADSRKILNLLGGPKYTLSWFEETFELVRKVLIKFIEKPFEL